MNPHSSDPADATPWPSLARDPELVAGIHQYCDRWCDRCPQTARCLAHKLERCETAPAAAARYWDAIAGSDGPDGVDRGRDTASGGHLLRTEAACTAGGAPGRSGDGAALHREAQVYRQTARELLLGLAGELSEVESDLQRQARLGEGTPAAIAAHIRNALEVIEWYVFFIEVKLRRALSSRLEEAEHGSAGSLSDADGSAKVALVAIDRSICAWRTLRDHIPLRDDAMLDVLVRLQRLGRFVEREFPRARAFRRPGLD